MWHLECSNDGRRIILPVTVLRAHPTSDLTGHQCTALLDTGATTSGITPRVGRALNLIGLGKRPLGSARGDEQVERYICRIGLQSTSHHDQEQPTYPFVFDPIMAFQLRDEFRFDVILGMDILAQCDFRMDRHRHTLLSFGA